MRDLDELAAYIAEDNEKAALYIEERILKDASLLSRFPLSGRAGRVSGTRERVVSRTPYILVYKIASGIVRVLRVYHGARKWPGHF